MERRSSYTPAVLKTVKEGLKNYVSLQGRENLIEVIETWRPDVLIFDPSLIRINRNPANIYIVYKNFTCTFRQLEILSLLYSGNSREETSHALGISPHTLKNHLDRVMDLNEREVTPGKKLRLSINTLLSDDDTVGIFDPDAVTYVKELISPTKETTVFQYTSKELEVLRLMAYGLSRNDAAKYLGKSPNTIKQQLKALRNRNHLQGPGRRIISMIRKAGKEGHSQPTDDQTE